VISARAKGVSTVPVPLVVPGVQDPDDPDLLDHLPGAHRYLAAPVQRGASRRQNPGVPAPFGPNWPGPAVAAKLASLGHLTKGELCREQALGFRCSHPSDTWGFKSLGTQTLGFGERLRVRQRCHAPAPLDRCAGARWRRRTRDCPSRRRSRNWAARRHIPYPPQTARSATLGRWADPGWRVRPTFSFPVTGRAGLLTGQAADDA
jgi:hypothetical protein